MRYTISAHDGRRGFTTVATAPDATTALDTLTALVAAGFRAQVAAFDGPTILDDRQPGRSRGWTGRNEDWEVVR